VARLSVKVAPKASRSAILGWAGEFLRVAVAAAPERGKANAAVEELIAEALDIPHGRVRVIVGPSGRRKTLAIDGLSDAEVSRRLASRGVQEMAPK